MTNYKIKKPAVTIYMPVFNAQDYLSQAIESILSQSYTNFEFIIVDDASTDASWKIIKSYARRDKRIRAFKNTLNLGVSLTSNIAISHSRGKFLARLDADDIAMPDRIKKQVQFLTQKKQVVAVGGQCVLIDKNNKTVGYKTFPTNPKTLSNMIFWAVPIQQPSMMINLQKLPKDFAWYDRSKSSAEEINLMFRMLQYGQLSNLSDYLIYYRQLPNSLSHRNPKLTYYLTLQSRIIAIENGYQPSLIGIIVNLAQFITVSILPTKFIYSLWNFVRGINQLNTNISLSLAKIGVKSY